MSKKLAISSSWFFQTYPYNPKLIHIQKLIEGVFLRYGILVSSIYISEYPKTLIIHFKVFVSHSCQYKLFCNLIELLESLLTLKYNKNIEMNWSISKSIYTEDKLISSWIKTKLDKNPSGIRFILKNLFRC